MKHIIIAFVLVCLIIPFIGCSKTDTPTEATTESYYIGNTSTKVFHRPSCSYLPDPANRIQFNVRQDAINAGYTPCGHCNP